MNTSSPVEQPYDRSRSDPLSPSRSRHAAKRTGYRSIHVSGVVCWTAWPNLSFKQHRGPEPVVAQEGVDRLHGPPAKA